MLYGFDWSIPAGKRAPTARQKRQDAFMGKSIASTLVRRDEAGLELKEEKGRVKRKFRM